MLKKRVAIIRGGPSEEYEVSLKTGAAVLREVETLGYTPIDIVISRSGEWLHSGMVRSPEQLLATADVVFIALHGTYGEDGTIQRICERLHIPFTGSNSYASSIAFNKDATKRHLQNHGIKMPKHVRVTEDTLSHLGLFLKALKQVMPKQYVVKPITSGSSYGVEMVADIDGLPAVLKRAVDTYGACMVEERIMGIEATCAILEDFRDEQHYALPPVEIVPPEQEEFFTLTAKYNGQTAEICPGRFDYLVRQTLSDTARLVHRELALTQYSRTDFIVRGKDVYFLEVNTLPGLTSESLFPKAAAAVGLPFRHLVDHLIKTARVR